MNRSDDQVGDSLAQLIADWLPDVICLQEAQGYLDVLRNRFDCGWWTYAHKDWKESGHNPVLTRRDLYSQKHRGQADGWDTVRTTEKWVGPQGGSHKGRTWTWVKVQGLWVMSLHRCTDGDGKNKAQFGAEYDALCKWMRNHSPCVVLGDHNCGPKKTHPGASKLVAQAVGGACRYDDTDPGIDYALTLGRKGTLERGKPYGSDHGATLLVVDS